MLLCDFEQSIYSEGNFPQCAWRLLLTSTVTYFVCSTLNLSKTNQSCQNIRQDDTLDLQLECTNHVCNGDMVFLRGYYCYRFNIYFWCQLRGWAFWVMHCPAGLLFT